MTYAAGYVQDVAYPAHFHREIQPLWLSMLTRFLGSAPPDLTRPYSYCELGCGVGINLLVAAATNPQGQFVGVDFNERHLTIARDAIRFQRLPAAPSAGPVTFATPIGEIQGPSDIFTPLLAALAQGPVSFAQLRQLPAFAGQLGTLSQSLQMLLWSGHLHPLREDADALSKPAARLTQWIDRQQLALRVVPECGTAVHAP